MFARLYDYYVQRGCCTYQYVISEIIVLDKVIRVNTHV